MTYTTPSITLLGSAHTLTLDRGGDNDNPCNGNSTLKCMGVGDGRSDEAGFS